jgi:hypothetical protein
MEFQIKLEALNLMELETLPRIKLQRIAKEVGVYDNFQTKK